MPSGKRLSAGQFALTNAWFDFNLFILIFLFACCWVSCKYQHNSAQRQTDEPDRPTDRPAGRLTDSGNIKGRAIFSSYLFQFGNYTSNVICTQVNTITFDWLSAFLGNGNQTKSLWYDQNKKLSGTWRMSDFFYIKLRLLYKKLNKFDCHLKFVHSWLVTVHKIYNYN